MRPHRPPRDLIPHAPPHRPAHEPGAAGAPNVVEGVGGGADDDDDDDDPRSRLQVTQLWLLLTVAWAVTGIVGVAMDAALVLLAASAELVTTPDVPPPHSDIPCWALPPLLRWPATRAACACSYAVPAPVPAVRG